MTPLMEISLLPGYMNVIYFANIYPNIIMILPFTFIQIRVKNSNCFVCILIHYKGLYLITGGRSSKF